MFLEAWNPGEGDVVVPKNYTGCLVLGARYRVRSFKAKSFNNVRYNGRPYVVCRCGDHFLAADSFNEDFAWFPKLRLVL